jgi:hypothetical protein
MILLLGRKRTEKAGKTGDHNLPPVISSAIDGMIIFKK